MTNEGFDEEALRRALRAPGSPTELADEQTYRAMFRAAQSPPAAVVPSAHGRTAVRRLGTGTTLAVVVALATGGVAAAYSSNLPAPVQRAVHSVLSPIGVPPAEPKRPVVEARQSPEPEPEPEAPVSSAPPIVRPSSSPSAHRSHKPSPAKTVKTVKPSPSTAPSASETPVLPSASPTEVPSSSQSTDPSTSPSPTDTPSPTTPPAPVPAGVSITSAGADRKVAPGGTAVVTGRVVAADGMPVPDAPVVLRQRGASGWVRVATARTDADGAVAVATGPVQRSTQVRLKTGKVRSAVWRLVVQPSVTATTQTVGKVSTVTAQVTGGQTGDRLVLVTTRSGQVVQEGTATVAVSGAVTFQVTAPNLDRWYVVQLPATADHGAARVRVLVSAFRPTPEE